MISALLTHDRLHPRFKHWGKMLVNSEYRKSVKEKTRLKRIPRYVCASTDILGPNLEMVDCETFLFTYPSIFEQQIYRFKTSQEAPFIIDGGANIGLSVIYFKKLFPDSRILAFEPDPKVFKTLEENCRSFDLKNVELCPNALWNSDEELSFQSEGSDSGHISDAENDKKIRVKAYRLKNLLNVEVAMLKLDIEGAEAIVLEDCREELKNVENIFVEYHSYAKREQTLSRVFEILHGAGFRMHLHACYASPQPFFERDINCMGMDLQLNVYGYRD
jgi:FkbM family methyltransferase